MQNDHLNFIPRLAIFVRKRELCPSALCSFNHWATTNLLTSKVKQFVWGKDVASCFILRLVTEMKKFTSSLNLLSQTADVLMVRECCWLLEGRVTQQSSSKQRKLHSWHNNYAFAWHGYVTIKKFKSNHQMFSTGAWKPGHETRNKAKGEYVFKTSFLFLPYISFHAKFELHGQALFQAFSASILNIEGRPKRYGSGLWCQVADDKDTLGEYLMKKLEWGPFLYL